MRRTLSLLCLLALIGTVVWAEPSAAHAPSGAIFTTLVNGSEVNFNHYDDKGDVYLDGGPGPGAPQHAAGLDDGIYVFQVTDPSGKVLLSKDSAKCRLVTVVDNVFTGVAASDASCVHATGADDDHGAATVQLIPYSDTPNPGGVYKAWVTLLEDFLAGCAALDDSIDALEAVDCGENGGNRHGFVNSHSKTDNFKVDATEILEIDTRFFDDHHDEGVINGAWIDHLGITWTDTMGVKNKKWSYYIPELVIMHEAHVEAVEVGTHVITVDNQPGCTVGSVFKDGVKLRKRGPQSVAFAVRKAMRTDTLRVDVACV